MRIKFDWNKCEGTPFRGQELNELQTEGVYCIAFENENLQNKLNRILP